MVAVTGGQRNLEECSWSSKGDAEVDPAATVAARCRGRRRPHCEALSETGFPPTACTLTELMVFSSTMAFLKVQSRIQ